jgi:hypothetical protein
VSGAEPLLEATATIARRTAGAGEPLDTAELEACERALDEASVRRGAGERARALAASARRGLAERRHAGGALAPARPGD